MTPPVRPSVAVAEPDPLELLKALRKRPTADANDPLERLKAIRAPRDPETSHGASREWGEESGLKAGARRLASAAANTWQDVNDRARAALHGPPGGKALEVGVSSLMPGKTYRGEHERITGEAERYKEANPSAARTMGIVGAMATGAASAPLMPARLAALTATPARAGATFGAADQALSADPDIPVSERALRTGAGAAAGATLGKLGETVGTVVRAVRAKPLATARAAREGAMTAADEVAYGAAAKEGAAAGGSHPAIQRVLKDARIAPFAAEIRASERWAGADDATVLRETYKLMSRKQRQIQKSIASADDHPADKVLTTDNIARAKKRLVKAADAVMPSFRPAVQGHAKMSRELQAFDDAADVTRQIVGKTTGRAAQSTTRSPQAFSELIAKMSPAERQAAIEGMLARLKERIGVQPNMVSGMGALTTAIRPYRAAPYLRRLGGTDQEALDQILRAALSMGTMATP